MRIKSLKLGLKTPKLSIPGISDYLPELSFEGTWERREVDLTVAWRVYVQSVSRIAVTGLAAGEGSLREALDSYYALFGEIRKALVEAGPELTMRRGTIAISLGEILLYMLNGVLRPLLTHWHPRLTDHEAQRPPSAAPIAYERSWNEAADLRKDMETARSALLEYLRFLEALCEIRFSLLPAAKPERPGQ